MFLMIDNYDSFTYNLVQYLAQLEEKPLVRRNDEVTFAEIERLSPQAIIISPGPKNPQQAGCIVELIRCFAPRLPLFGVCLGHQAIGAAFGARIVHAARVMHGKTSQVQHDGKTIFAGLPNPLAAGRYHSLAIERESLPDCLEISAVAPDGEIMGVRHREYFVEGVQFHPESVLTPQGKRLLRNFVNLVKQGIEC